MIESVSNKTALPFKAGNAGKLCTSNNKGK